MGGGNSKGKEKYVFILLGRPLKLIDPLRREASTDDEYPLPKPNYDTLKDKQIKDMLAEQQLPTTGDRSAWIARHQRYFPLPTSEYLAK